MRRASAPQAPPPRRPPSPTPPGARSAAARSPKPCRQAPTTKQSVPSLGAGGEPTPPDKLAAIAREIAGGDPVTFVDLAAFDGQLRRGDVLRRPAGLGRPPVAEVLRVAGYAAYALSKLPEPRGLVFHLKTVDQYLAVAPQGTDLMLGYPPSFDELTAFPTTPPAPNLPRHRVRILVDSLELLDHLIALAPRSTRGTPVEVALHLEGGLELSGFRETQELSTALEKLRSNQDHGTFRPDRAYRQQVKDDCERRFARWLAQLEAEGSDLYDPATLVRNGPASSTYTVWAGSKVPTRSVPARRSSTTATSPPTAATTRACASRCATPRRCTGSSRRGFP